MRIQLNVWIQILTTGAGSLVMTCSCQIVEKAQDSE